MLLRVLQVLVAVCGITIPWAAQWTELNLPEEHIPPYLHNHPDLQEICLQDEHCPYKSGLQHQQDGQPMSSCWGYEDDCLESSKLPECPGDSKFWAKDKMSQRRSFWESADFGYVRTRRSELKYYCTPSEPDDSSLQCVDHLLYCQATNFFVDLSTANLVTSSNSYREDMLSAGQIGGKCLLDRDALSLQLDHKSPLQSWAAEFEHFTSVSQKPLSSNLCDVLISKPTYVIKLDATVNMYHHFCDYVNLYISQHLNNSFSTDVNILIWDTSGHPMSTMFAETWTAFSDHTPLRLKDFDGKKVCFRQVVFSFLARMRFGLYYNMPLIPGCHGSSLIKAFSHHVVHRLHLPQHGPLQNKIRVTLLSRSTKYRQILNEDELMRALQTDFEFEVHKVDFVRSVPFLEQLKISHNSDIFLGMHGAGLTHMLFQPDWAVVIELYNCEDPDCYYDLARLRGIHYMTWENKQKLTQEDEGHHPTLGAHAKFTNYAFDVEEFMRLMRKAAQHVHSHPAFKTAHKLKFAAQAVSRPAANVFKDGTKLHSQNRSEPAKSSHHDHIDL